LQLAITIDILHTACAIYSEINECRQSTKLLLGRELGLDGVDLPVVNPEGLGEDVGGHRRRGAEERHGDGLRALELAVEGGDDGGGAVPPVLLEVDEPPGEDEDVPLADDLGEELVGGGDEADLDSKFYFYFGCNLD